MPDIQIASLDGSSLSAYVAPPPGGNGPGLLFVHEIFGLNPAMRKTCDAFAAKGFISLCPDLFGRQGGQLFSAEPDWEQASRLYKNFDIEAALRDLLAALAHLRQMPGCAGKVGVVGSCLGARLAFLMAARSDVDCSVCYDGVGIDSLLDEAYDIRKPLLLHVGEKDKLFPPAAQKKVLHVLSRNPALCVHIYPRVEHGFARRGGASFHPEAAALALARTESFLKDHLLK